MCVTKVLQWTFFLLLMTVLSVYALLFLKATKYNKAGDF